MENITDEMKLEALEEAMYKIIEDAKEEKSKKLLEVEQVYKEKDEIASLKDGPKTQLARTTRDVMANIQRESDAFNREKELEEKYKSNVINGEKLDKEKILKIIEEEFESKKQAVVKDEEKIDKVFESKKNALLKIEELNKKNEELVQEKSEIEAELKNESNSTQIKSDTREVIANIKAQADKSDRRREIEQELKELKKKISTEKGKITTADKKIKGFLEEYNIDLEKIKLEAEKPIAEEPVAEKPIVEEPVAEEPVAEEPVAEQPAAEEPVAEEPVVEEPVAEEPVAEEPAVEEPVVEKPIVEEPVAAAQAQPATAQARTVAQEPVAEQPKLPIISVKRDINGITINGKFVSIADIKKEREEIDTYTLINDKFDNDLLLAAKILSEKDKDFDYEKFEKEYDKLENKEKDANDVLTSQIAAFYSVKFRLKAFASMDEKQNIYDLEEAAYRAWKNDIAKVDMGVLTKLKFNIRKFREERKERKALKEAKKLERLESGKPSTPPLDPKTRETIKDVVLDAQKQKEYWERVTEKITSPEDIPLTEENKKDFEAMVNKISGEERNEE